MFIYLFIYCGEVLIVLMVILGWGIGACEDTWTEGVGPT